MSPDVVAVRETSTVEEAVQHIRKTVTEERPFGSMPSTTIST
jgi:hypothetical protein